MTAICTDEFTTKRYKSIAKEFFGTYVRDGGIAAAKQLYEEHVPESDLPQVSEMIQQEFLKNGWTFPDEQE